MYNLIRLHRLIKSDIAKIVRSSLTLRRKILIFSDRLLTPNGKKGGTHFVLSLRLELFFLNVMTTEF